MKLFSKDNLDPSMISSMSVLKKNRFITLGLEFGITPLHLAALEGLSDVAGHLIDQKADINAKSESGITPLHLAALCGHLDIVKKLTQSRAKINSKSATRCQCYQSFSLTIKPLKMS